MIQNLESGGVKAGLPALRVVCVERTYMTVGSSFEPILVGEK